MMKHLKDDEEADEQLFKVFVFFGTFIGCSAILIASMSAMFAWASGGHFDPDSTDIQIGGYEFSMINATYGITSGNLTGFYPVTESDYQPIFMKDDEDNLYFHDTVNNDDLQLAPLMDMPLADWSNTIEIFERWGWWSTEDANVPFDDIKNNQIAGTNASAVSFSIHGKTYDLVVITASDSFNHSDLIDERTYWVGISYDAYDPDNMASTSLWGVLGQILTAQLPNVHPMIQYFILIPFWAGISFMVFTLISRMIPFISGG